MESLIGVLTNAVLAKLHDSALPSFLWAEAYDAAIHPHTLGGRTLYEVLYGVKPGVSHFRAFRAPSAIIEPKERLRTLDNRATMSFFVGYKYDGGGYRVWDPK